MDHHQHHQHPSWAMDTNLLSSEASLLSNNNTDSKLCSGMPMVMYMDGFHWTLREHESSCLNLYVTHWTLDTHAKVYAAMLGVALLAVATEGMSRLRHQVRKQQQRRRESAGWAWIQTMLHGLHALLGYVVMLATMTFSLELLCSVILGLVVGYVLFEGDIYTHITTNPCCAFLEEEALQREQDEQEEVSVPPYTTLASDCCDEEDGDNIMVHSNDLEQELLPRSSVTDATS